MYKIVISINNGAKIKNVFLKEKIFGYKLSFFKDSQKEIHIFNIVKRKFPNSLIPDSRLSVFRLRRNIEAGALLLYIYLYIYNNKRFT